MTRLILALGCVLCVSGTATAQQVWVSLGGGYLSQSGSFGDALRFSEYFEPAAVEAIYPERGGVVIDAAGRIGVQGGLSVGAGVAVFTRSSDATVRGQLPHPLHFAQPRTIEQVIEGVGRREVAFRGELAWTTPLARRLRLTVSAGPMAVRASQDMASQVTVAEQGYPFDVAALRTQVENEHAWGLGATAAVEAGWAVTPRVGIGVTARYSRATVSLRGRDTDAAGPSVIAAITTRLH